MWTTRSPAAQRRGTGLRQAQSPSAPTKGRPGPVAPPFRLRSFFGVRRKTPSRRANPWTHARAIVQLDARLMMRLSTAQRREMFVHCRKSNSMLTRATAIRLMPQQAYATGNRKDPEVRARQQQRSRGEQRNREQHHEEVPHPAEARHEVVTPLLAGQAVVGREVPRQQAAPVQAEDLHASEAPAVPLRAQAGVGRRDDPATEDSGDVQPGPSKLQHADGRLGVLTDAPLVPAARLFEGAAAEESHRSHEGYGVPLVARRHVREIEGLIRVHACRVIRAPLVVTVTLEALEEPDALVGEVGRRLLQVVGQTKSSASINPMISARSSVYRRKHRLSAPALNPGQGSTCTKVTRCAIAAIVLDGSPDRRVLGVVVDHDDLEVGIVDCLGPPDGLDQHLRRLVVHGNVQGDEGLNDGSAWGNGRK